MKIARDILIAFQLLSDNMGCPDCTSAFSGYESFEDAGKTNNRGLYLLAGEKGGGA